MMAVDRRLDNNYWMGLLDYANTLERNTRRDVNRITRKIERMNY